MKRRFILLILTATAVAFPASASEDGFGPWAPAVRAESIPGTDPEFNGSALDGCPFISRDGKTFYTASDRPGGLGGIDIWVSTRARADDPWGEPINVGAPVNSEANDFCPTISRDGHLFFFVSNRPGGCGGADIYVARLRDHGEFDDPENVGCAVNSTADEASPFSSSTRINSSVKPVVPAAPPSLNTRTVATGTEPEVTSMSALPNPDLPIAGSRSATRSGGSPSAAIEVADGAAIFYGATVDKTTGDPSLQIARAAL